MHEVIGLHIKSVCSFCFLLHEEWSDAVGKDKGVSEWQKEKKEKNGCALSSAFAVNFLAETNFYCFQMGIMLYSTNNTIHIQ